MKKILIICALVVAAVLLSGSMGREYALTTVTHVVQPRETLWEIACRYQPRQDRYRDLRELIWEIRETNNLNPQKHLQPGQEIKVPLWLRKESVK